PRILTDVNGTLYFSADDGVHGMELWKSGGTGNSTVLVQDIFPGSGSARPYDLGGPELLTYVNGSLYFRANDSITGYEPLILRPVNVYGNSGAHAWPGHIDGTASDSFSGIASVALTIQRNSDGAFWNGASWQVTRVTVAAEIGSGTWTYDFAGANL